MERAVARDWHFYGLLSVIEVERHRKSNPPLPEWLGAGYRQAWSELLNVALADLKMQVDRETLRAMLSVVALAKGDVRLGAVLVQSDESEIMEILERYDAWSELYTEQGLASDAHKDARG
jgi:hypothetical protein